MEVRGLGIINVAALFGIGSIRLEKRLDLVCTLKLTPEIESLDRHGLDQKYFHLLGLRIPEVEIPVAAGRDVAQLVEVAALDQKLRSYGYNAAVEFDKKLIKLMRERTGMG